MINYLICKNNAPVESCVSMQQRKTHLGHPRETKNLPPNRLKVENQVKGAVDELKTNEKQSVISHNFDSHAYS